MSIKPIDIIRESTGDDQPWVRSVRDAVRDLRYGSVEVVVHEGRVVQIERRDKVRFDEAGRRRPDDRGRDTTNHHRTDRLSGGSVPAKAEETNR
jgi:hypothetical protein